MTGIKRKQAGEGAESAPLILLDEFDNVLIAIRDIVAGDVIDFDEATFTASDNIAVGHKLARVDLAEGDKVLKYGAPIGVTTRAVSRGAHVHSHNLRSNYIASHSREDNSA